MSGLIYTQCSPDGSLVEATVMAVDVLRYCCEVKTNHGQKLSNVQWLQPSGGSSRTGNHITPTVGDKVIVSFSLSYPIILGFLPNLEAMSALPVQIDSGFAVGDTGNRSSMQDPNGRINPGKPEDMVSGDHLWSSEGGGLLGLLRGGTFIARASRLAQIVISKFDDLVRIVGRNYEVFTDVFIDSSYNLKGRIYRFIGYAKMHSEVRADNYSYKEYFGDTSLGEYAENNGFVDNVYNGAFPTANSTLRKVKVIQNGSVVYDQVLDVNGHKKDTNHNGGTSYIDQMGTQIQVSVTNGGSSTNTLTGSNVELNQNGTSIINLTGSTITLTQGSSSTITLSNSSIVMTFAGGGIVTVDANGAKIGFGAHYLNVNASGVQSV